MFYFPEMNFMKREQVINRDPDILGGTPVFTGTRVPVQTLIDYLKAGDSLDDFLEGFPSVSREQAQAFLEIAPTRTRSDSIPREESEYSLRDSCSRVSPGTAILSWI